MFRFALAGAVAGNGHHYALGVLKLVDGVLELAVEDGAIGDDNDGAKQLLRRITGRVVIGIGVEGGKLVGNPGDGV